MWAEQEHVFFLSLFSHTMKIQIQSGGVGCKAAPRTMSNDLRQTHPRQNEKFRNGIGRERWGLYGKNHVPYSCSQYHLGQRQQGSYNSAVLSANLHQIHTAQCLYLSP